MNNFNQFASVCVMTEITSVWVRNEVICSDFLRCFVPTLNSHNWRNITKLKLWQQSSVRQTNRQRRSRSLFWLPSLLRSIIKLTQVEKHYEIETLARSSVRCETNRQRRPRSVIFVLQMCRCNIFSKMDCSVLKAGHCCEPRFCTVVAPKEEKLRSTSGVSWSFC